MKRERERAWKEFPLNFSIQFIEINTHFWCRACIQRLNGEGTRNLFPLILSFRRLKRHKTVRHKQPEFILYVLFEIDMSWRVCECERVVRGQRVTTSGRTNRCMTGWEQRIRRANIIIAPLCRCFVYTHFMSRCNTKCESEEPSQETKRGLRVSERSESKRPQIEQNGIKSESKWDIFTWIKSECATKFIIRVIKCVLVLFLATLRACSFARSFHRSIVCLFAFAIHCRFLVYSLVVFDT